MAGAVADVVGSRRIYLIGCFLLACFVVASGLACTGIQLIMFRSMQGVAVALCLPTSVAILTNAMPSGRGRNLGFAFLGLGQPFGFSIGLVLGGVLIDTVGWRVGWYACGGTIFALLVVGVWTIPPDNLAQTPSLARLRSDIDWIGALLSSACLSMLAYVLV